MSSVDLSARIPNNVDLAQDSRLLRALEEWQPNYLGWWREMGPEGFQEKDVWLRTAVSVDAEGWAQFDYVKMPDYRWGIFLAEPTPDRKIGFGDLLGQPAWSVVPGEHRNTLRRLIVTQGDTEPASVEQQQRRSGDPDKPRILGAFNQAIDNWLDFFMFTMFTDRDGKYQLLALAESGFDPLSRTTRFMLTEEAHHMFVGETGVERMVQRTAELTKLDRNGDVRTQGGIPLDVIQKHLNLWFALSLDLFGGEISSNAASFFAAGLKGRYNEERYEDHLALGQPYRMSMVQDSRVVEEEVPLRTAMNEVLRDAYVEDCQRGVDRWNKRLADAGLSDRLRLPSKRFYRRIGLYADLPFDPEGRLLAKPDWERRRSEWLPAEEDRAYVASLQKPVREAGKIANWLARPARGVKGMPFEHEYVRLD